MLITDIADTERALRRRIHQLEALNRVAREIAYDLDLGHVVQIVTDAATELSGASFGAFFYNVSDEKGERYILHALSGASKHAFEKFGLPRNTAVFDPTFRGIANIRSDDIRLDNRYGQSAPHFGMPKGHLPVVSYLAVPVVSPSGEVHGGLFLGHHQPGIFSADSEDMVSAIASQAALALDNARLLAVAKSEGNRQRVRGEAAQRLAAIVESSDDAIISKDLNGVIASWNKGAELLFGYTTKEAVGKPVTLLIPEDRHDEEPTILARIRRGEKIDHYETIRRRKDGTPIDVSLSVSPIKNRAGKIIGASKIARDITDRRRAQQQQQLLLREMNHRIKNLFALAGSVVSLSARSTNDVKKLTSVVRDRLAALARAQALTLPRGSDDDLPPDSPTSLRALIQTIVSPYLSSEHDDRVRITGGDIPIGAGSITSFALLLHEFATNAAKYGALSTPNGHVEVKCSADANDVAMTWTETGGPQIDTSQHQEGFGSVLMRATVERQLGGSISPNWKPEGLEISLRVSRERL